MIFKNKNDKITLLMFLKIPFRYTPKLVLVLCVQKIIDAILPALLLVATANFIDQVLHVFQNKANYEVIYISIAYMIVLLMAKLILDTVLLFWAKKISLVLNNRINLECMEFHASLSYQYIDNQDSYMITQRVLQELPDVINQVFYNMLNLLNIVVRFLSLSIVFFMNDVLWVALLIILVSIPMIGVTYRNGKKIYLFYKENFSGEMEMYHSSYILKDRVLTNERTLFGFTNIINKKWKKMEYELFKKKLKVNNKIINCRFVARLINLACVFCIIFIMTFQAFEGHITVGLYAVLVTNVLALVDQVIMSATELSNHISQETEFLKDFKRLCSYSLEEEIRSEPANVNITIKELEFKDVSFSYPGTDRKVLDHISFKIEAGKTYAFVGKNGAGKSTIIKLLTRLYDDFTGEILINQKSIKEYTYAEIKAIIGVIYQDFAKYELTLQDMIDIGAISKQIQKEEREQVIEQVGLSNLVNKLPKGEYTHIGKLEEDGVDLSGGEWQRLAIARLLIKKSDFMILDEPTAALDPMAESNLYQLFEMVSHGKTTILISHRMGSIKMADHIFVVDKGHVCEKGNHETLMKKDGLYAYMYNEQKAWYV